jgi:hypothetical protein
MDEIGFTVYEEMSFKVKVYGRTPERQTNGRRTKSDHKSSPCHFVTGELKIQTYFFHRGILEVFLCKISEQ